MKANLPYLRPDRDRYGVMRYYVRRYGRKIRIRETPGTDAFLQAYSEARAALDPGFTDRPDTIAAAPSGTLGWLAARYFASTEFCRLNPKSQRIRRNVIEDCLREPRKPGVADLMRDCPLSALSSAHVKMFRDRKAKLPGAANNRRKYLSSMFGWAVEDGFMTVNPARDIRRIKYATDGFHTWTPDEVRQFEARHPIGTKARLALSLLLYLGVRRGDVVRLGRQHVEDGWLRIVPSKTSYKRKEISQKPVLPVLADIIGRSSTGDLTFLVTNFGKPFTVAGFGNWFRERCNEAGLPQCSAHGLRKAGAKIAAERGATTLQLMAIFDWTTPAQAEVYTRAADRKRLAKSAVIYLAERSDTEQEESHS
jgi:integrase